MIDEILYAALAPIGVPVEPMVYTADADEYIGYFYEARGTVMTDDAPQYTLYDVTITWVAPHEADSSAMRERIRAALKTAGMDDPIVYQEEDATVGAVRMGAPQRLVCLTQYLEYTGVVV